MKDRAVALSLLAIEAVLHAPCSVRWLADAAGVPHSTLVRIVNGERRCTPEVAAALAGALEGWASTCSHHAAALRAALEDA